MNHDGSNFGQLSGCPRAPRVRSGVVAAWVGVGLMVGLRFQILRVRVRWGLRPLNPGRGYAVLIGFGDDYKG